MSPRRRPGRGTAATAAATLLAWLWLPAAATAQPPPSDGEDDRPQVYDEKGRPIPRPEDKPKQPKITLPEVIEYVDPVYPEAAKKAGLEGEVILKLEIDIDGNVASAEVLRPAGHGFDEAALAAAKQLRFSPARYENGNPFRAAIRYRFRFELAAPDSPVEPAAPTKGVLRGRLFIRDVEEPLAGATLTVTAPDGQVRTATTGPAGEFSFPDLPAGAYRVDIAAAGYEGLSITETVEAGKELLATYRLSAETQGGALEVIVEGERPAREITRRTLERREIDRIPGTQGDAIKSIQNLPGLARPPAILGALLVRGSSPADTQAFIDGIYVPLIFHFGGLSSVIPTELLDKIDFYPGNFSARYGRAMGGIVDVGIRSPRSDGYHGVLQADLIDARVLLEGPVPNVDGWTFAAAGRRSYLDAWLGPALEQAGAGVTTAPRYWDYQLMVERKWEQKARFRVAFYGTDDKLEILLNSPSASEPAISGTLGFATAFQRLQLHYSHELTADDKLSVDLGLSRDVLSTSVGQLFFDLETLGLIGRAEYKRRLAKSAVLNVGLDMWGGTAGVMARVPYPPVPGQPPNQPFSTRSFFQLEQRDEFYRPAAYLEMELSPTAKWRIVPGVRLDYARDSEAFDAAPRLSSRYTFTDEFPHTTLKGGLGLFYQPPQFQQSQPPFGTAGLSSNRAVHYGLGVEQDITKQLEVSLDGFFRQLDDQVMGAPTQSGGFVRYTNQALGYAVGGELLLKYKPDERFFGWLAYTLSRSVRQNGPDEPEYLVSFDQTHILTVLGSYQVGRGWEVGARFRLVSGNRLTPQVCSPAAEDCDPNRIGGLLHAATGAYTPIPFGSQNEEQLPMFHQLDLRIDKKFQFKSWALSGYLDIQNVYNNQNYEGISYNFNFTARQFVTGVPILPSIGLRGEF